MFEPLEEVIERRRTASTISHCFGFARKIPNISKAGGGRRVRRRPTLRYFLRECEERRKEGGNYYTPFGEAKTSFASLGVDAMPTDDVNFRLQQRYWGKIRSMSSSEEDEEDDDDDRSGTFSSIQEEDVDTLITMKDPSQESLKSREKKTRAMSDGDVSENPCPPGQGEPTLEQEILRGHSFRSHSGRDSRGRRFGREWNKRIDKEGKLIDVVEQVGQGRVGSTRRRLRSFSQPNLGTLERFEKVPVSNHNLCF